MSIGLIGKKSGMSRLFLEDGESVPVTAVSVCGNFVADIKTRKRMDITHLLYLNQKNLRIFKNHKKNFLKKLI